ncbi:MAG: tetratricopeptide repeat protein [Bacteroidetes bacterium]|nr:MAG: tetratricopeptide repeat protein [Bacteroidota bacterium]
MSLPSLKPRLTRALLVLVTFCYCTLSFAQKDARQKHFDSLFALRDTSIVLNYLNAEQKKNPNDWWPLYTKAWYLAVDSNILPSQQMLLKAIQLNPNCFKCYVQLGRNEMYWGNTDQALIYLEKGKEIGQNDPYPSIYLGMYYEIVEQSKALALMHYNRAISQDAEYAYGYLARGNYHFNSANYFAAKNDLNKAVALDSQMADAHYLLGQIYTNFDQADLASEHLIKAYLLDSNNANYRLGMAVSLTNSGRHEESLPLYTEFVEAHPDKPFYLCSRASVYYQLENMDAFCEDLRKADQLSKDMPEFRKEFRIDAEMQKTCDKNRASYYFQRGVAAYNRQLYDTALQWYFRCDQLYPKHSFNMSFIGNAYLAMERYDSALAAYQLSFAWQASLYDESIEVGKPPREAETYVAGQKLYVQLYIAECHLRLGNLDSAYRYLEAVRPYLGFQEIPIAGYFYSLESEYYFYAQKPDQALIHINKAIQAEPGNPKHLLLRVFYRLNKPTKKRVYSFKFSLNSFTAPRTGSFMLPMDAVDGNFVLEECLRDCDLAVKLEPSYHYAYLMRAQILQKLNRKSAACADYKLLEKAGYVFSDLSAPCAP